MIALSARNFRLVLAVLGILLSASYPRSSTAADLDDYIKRSDTAFSWKETRQPNYSRGNAAYASSHLAGLAGNLLEPRADDL